MKKAWITFRELTYHLGVPTHTHRTLKRELIGTHWVDLLLIQRLDPKVHSRSLPQPPSESNEQFEEDRRPWVMSRKLVRLHRKDLMLFLFG